MISYRVIARLDIKGENLIKGVAFEGLRVLGKPIDFAKKYAVDGADELLYLDTVASLYGRNHLAALIEDTSASAFIPLTVAGGIRAFEQARDILRSGADKICINTAALACPALIDDIAARIGCQALTVSIEAKRVNGGWEAYAEGGRQPSGRDAVAWAHEAVTRGAGEILLTSIDRDGRRAGPDLELLKAVTVDVPLVYGGGVRLQDVATVARHTQGLAMGAALHYGDTTIAAVKSELAKNGLEVRT